MHMRKLEELEYVLVHRGGRGQSFVYELLYDGAGRDGKPFLMGLSTWGGAQIGLRRKEGASKSAPGASKEPPRSAVGAGK